MSSQQNNTTGQNDQHENGSEDTSSSIFISQVEFDKMIQQMQKDIRNKTNMKIINKFASHIPKKAIKKMNKWLASSHSLLSSNKTARAYHLNTMLDKDTSAQGITQTFQLVNDGSAGYVNVKSHADGLALSFDSPNNITSNGENIGFPIVEEKINELLQERLTDSLGKQSPTSGKVYDLRSIINANTLPVYKNGSLAYMHRIVETLLHCYAYCSGYNARTTTEKGTPCEVMVNVYGPEDLENAAARADLEARQTIDKLSLVSKAINAGDLTVDILRWACSQLFLNVDNAAKLHTSFRGNTTLNIYSQVKPIIKTPNYVVMNDETYTKTGYYSFPASWIKSVPTSSGLSFYYYENRQWYKIAAENVAVYYYFSNSDHNPSVLKTDGNITIDGNTYSWTTTSGVERRATLTAWYGYRPLGFTVMENVQDIINAIYILAYLTCTICWKATSNSSMNYRTVCWTDGTNTETGTKDVLRLMTSSIYARIAQVYGQLKYLDDLEFNIPTENELGNKVHNLGYYLAGLYAKDANKRYGSINLVETYMPQVVKNCWIQGPRCIPYDVGEKEIQIPLHYIVDKNDTRYTNYSSEGVTLLDLYTESQNQISYVEYFTDAAWWRYDYFGGYEISAPKQQISVNDVDRKFDETAQSVFMNTATTKGDALITGQAFIRWTANGSFNAVNFAVRSYCQNTAVKFVIPNLYKNRSFVSGLKLHGLDLIGANNVDPIWYAPYNSEAELIDDGSFDQKMLDALFD